MHSCLRSVDSGASGGPSSRSIWVVLADGLGWHPSGSSRVATAGQLAQRPEPRPTAPRPAPRPRPGQAGSARRSSRRGRQAAAGARRWQSTRAGRATRLRAGARRHGPPGEHTTRRACHREGMALRGAHKIFLGMAPGVGKTYQMLEEAHEEKDRGRDVVIGYLSHTAAPRRCRRPRDWSRCRDRACNTPPARAEGRCPRSMPDRRALGS